MIRLRLASGEWRLCTEEYKKSPWQRNELVRWKHWHSILTSGSESSIFCTSERPFSPRIGNNQGKYVDLLFSGILKLSICLTSTVSPSNAEIDLMCSRRSITFFSLSHSSATSVIVDAPIQLVSIWNFTDKLANENTCYVTDEELDPTSVQGTFVLE